MRDGFWAAQEGGNFGEAAVLAKVCKTLMGGEAAQAGNQAVAVGFGGLAEFPDLDRLAQAGGGDGTGKLCQRLGVELGAVARQGFGVDLMDGDEDVGGHAGSDL